tara:strand:- start:1681 stop:1935 length:255 start_codon:yes stop_codon:yes gene_type:complete
MVLDSIYMVVKVLAFGPLAQELGGREHRVNILPNSSVRFILEEMGIDSWLDNGLKISINDVIVNEDEPVNDGDEIALLPPVSGG